jgi:hypothetical protein
MVRAKYKSPLRRDSLRTTWQSVSSKDDHDEKDPQNEAKRNRQQEGPDERSNLTVNHDLPRSAVIDPLTTQPTAEPCQPGTTASHLWKNATLSLISRDWEPNPVNTWLIILVATWLAPGLLILSLLLWLGRRRRRSEVRSGDPKVWNQSPENHEAADRHGADSHPKDGTFN